MASVKVIREALAASLTVIPSLQVSAYELENPMPPAAHVIPGGPAGPIEYHLALRNGVELWPFAVQVFVALGLARASQENLDRYLASHGDYSVKAALEADRTLGGAVHDVTVVSCRGTVRFQAESPLIGSEWVVHVRARGEE